MGPLDHLALEIARLAASADKRNIAVWPFRMMPDSPPINEEDSSLDHLLQEELIHQLLQNKFPRQTVLEAAKLKASLQSSSPTYSASDFDTYSATDFEAMQNLGVDIVVIGTYVNLEDSLRVLIRLIDPSTNKIIASTSDRLPSFSLSHLLHKTKFAGGSISGTLTFRKDQVSPFHKIQALHVVCGKDRSYPGSIRERESRGITTIDYRVSVTEVGKCQLLIIIQQTDLRREYKIKGDVIIFDNSTRYDFEIIHGVTGFRLERQ